VSRHRKFPSSDPSAFADEGLAQTLAGILASDFLLISSEIAEAMMNPSRDPSLTQIKFCKSNGGRVPLTALLDTGELHDQAYRAGSVHRTDSKSRLCSYLRGYVHRSPGDAMDE
jgi:hypothetical protein